MPPRSRLPAARTPSIEEAQLLTVYQDAERYLLETIGTSADEVATDADAGRATAAAEARGARRVRQAVEQAVTTLDKGAKGRTERIIGAAAEGGSDEAVRQLAAVQRGVRLPPGTRVDRGALDRLAVSTLDLITPAHRSILRTVPDAYRDVITRTVSAVLVGAQTRRDASQRAMWALTDRGITGFTDARGRRWRLSAYVEMATRTAAARAHTDALLDRLAVDGHDLVIVSGAANECDRCTPWERTVLRRTSGPTGRVQLAHHLTEKPITVDIAGTVDEARAAGLLHPNCRHALSLYLPGVTRAPEVRRNPDGYAADQRQRGIERHLRDWKEREAAALTPDAKRQAKARVTQWGAVMRDHLKANPDLRRKREREGIGGGNVPTDALRSRLPGGPLAPAARGTARTPAQMPAAELDRRLRRARTDGDTTALQLLAAERARRDAALTARRRARIARNAGP